MIPKIIHYCWFGRKPLPELAVKCIESWKKNCPDYEIVEWNEDNFDINMNGYIKEAYDSKKWAFVTDFVRLFVCGSDQIWAPSCFDDKYFLSFVDDDEKKISYAPSIGLKEVSNPNIKIKMAELVCRFRHLSIRETLGADIIRDLTGKEANVVLDPTLLLDREEWNDYVKINNSESVHKLSEDYIICYFLGDEKKYYKYVKNIQRRVGANVYIIPVRKKTKYKKVPYEVGPSEFVQLIKNAKYVCTDSFHGTLFSIIYNIPFSTFERFKENDVVNQNSRYIAF